jgi:hypothetical protein
MDQKLPNPAQLRAMARPPCVPGKVCERHARGLGGCIAGECNPPVAPPSRVTATPAPQPAGITKEQLQQWHDYMGSLMQQAGVQSSEVIGDLYRAYLEAPTNGVIASDGSRRG